MKFKNWMEVDIADGIAKFGDEFVDDLHLPSDGGPFLPRLLYCLIRAHTEDDPIDAKELRDRIHKAMKALTGRGLPRSDKKDDAYLLRWMADNYVADREQEAERRRATKPRSIDRLAEQAATNEEGFIDVPAVERLRQSFSLNKSALLKNTSEKSLALEMVHRSALHDISERLEALGIPMWPDE
jgi:hypothetical protein